jgi:hypothetical protein
MAPAAVSRLLVIAVSRFYLVAREQLRERAATATVEREGESPIYATARACEHPSAELLSNRCCSLAQMTRFSRALGSWGLES